MDIEIANRLVQTLQEFIDQTAQYINQYSIYPEDGSPGSIELESFSRRESVHTAHSLGTTLIEAAADHSMAMAKTLTEPVQAFAPWICLRSVLESSALSYWIMDIDISVRVRVQRGFALRYKGLRQQEKIARAMNDIVYLNRITKRMDQVEQDALQLGYDRVLSKNDNRIGIAIQMPPLTDIVRDTLNAESVYRYLSAITHAHHWAIRQVGFQEVDEKRVGITTLPNTRIMEKGLLASSVVDLCQSATIFLSIPLWQKSCLFGWDLVQLDRLYTSIFKSMSIREAHHRWTAENEDKK